MIDLKDATFPLDLDGFIKLQENEIKRKATPGERELFSEVVDLANAAYRAGCVADADTIQALLDTVAAVDTGEETRFLCGLCRGWILEGAKRGLALLASMGESADATGGPVS